MNKRSRYRDRLNDLLMFSALHRRVQCGLFFVVQYNPLQFDEVNSHFAENRAFSLLGTLPLNLSIKLDLIFAEASEYWESFHREVKDQIRPTVANLLIYGDTETAGLKDFVNDHLIPHFYMESLHITGKYQKDENPRTSFSKKPFLPASYWNRFLVFL